MNMTLNIKLDAAVLITYNKLKMEHYQIRNNLLK